MIEFYGLGECAVCGRKIKVGLLMCAPDWAKVGTFRRNQVYGALRLWNAGECDYGVLREAQDAAILEAGGTPAPVT